MDTLSQPANEIYPINLPGSASDDTFPALGWYVDLPLWMRNRFAAGSIAHNYPIPLRIRGPLDRTVLERSVFEILRRHCVLRSVFRTVHGKLAQVITPVAPVTILVVNLLNLPEDSREPKAQQLIIEEATRPFDLSRGPLLRTCLLRLNTEDHILTLTTHHAVCDYWSTGILISELFTLCAAFQAGKPSPLPELNYHYADFSRWLQERLDNGKLASRFAFWRERLGDGNDFHHVPTDRPRPAQQSYQGRHAIVNFPELADAIRALIVRERVTPFMTMLAAFQCLLHHYSGNEDIGVGSCVANRPLAQTEQLVGPFGNVVVIRTNLSDDPTLREVLRRVRKVTLTAYSFQDLPFGTLVEHLRPARDPSRNPLFQSLLVFRNAPTRSWPASDQTVTAYPVETDTTRYELNLWLTMDTGLEVDLQYNSDLFEAETINDLLENYRVILRTLVDNPEKRLRELRLPHPITIRSAQHCTAAVDRMNVSPAFHGSGQPSVHVEPVDRVQRALVQIWKSVLGTPELNINTDFFSLGGDSLRATQLLTRIEQKFGTTLSMESLLTAGTIQQQAEVIRLQEVGPARGTVKRETTPQTGPNMQPSSGGHATSAQPHNPDNVDGKSLLRRGVNRVLHLLCRFVPGGTTLRPFLHRMRGVRIGKNVWIGDDVYLENEYPERVELQDGAMVGMRTTIVAHTRGPGKIVIGKDAFVGVSCVIVTSGNRPLVIGEGAVIMASSLVSGSVAPYTLYGSDGAKPLAKVTKPFMGTTSYEEFIVSLRPLQD